jgi:hypothetical protein
MNEKRVSGHSTLRPVHGAALHISSDLLPFCLAGVLISSDAGTFDLGVQRYRDAVGTLGTRVGKSEQASEAPRHGSWCKSLLGDREALLPATGELALDLYLCICRIT